MPKREFTRGRPTNRAVGRLRSHLTTAELQNLLDGAGRDRWNGLRNRTLILMMARHALRVGEAVDLRWSVDIDWNGKTLFCRRLKAGKDGLHPLAPDELEALTELKKKARTDFVFESSRKRGLSKSTVNKMLKTLGEKIGVPYLCPHMLRHTACTMLVGRNVGLITVQRYAGHSSIGSTTKYVGFDPRQFQGIWG